MTIAMKLMHSALPESEDYPLPPREIIDETAKRVELQDDLSEETKTALTFAGHFAYGTATGALYPVLFSNPNPVNGALYGLGVWGVSYLGLLPAAGILGSAVHHPARRNALMIAAHLVWGASAGAAAQRMKDK
jgi:uncharacterized membrane protein YagU involved in acid resistance